MAETGESFLAGKLEGLNKLTNKATDERAASEKKTRDILTKQTRRLDLTMGILEQNLDVIRELAKNDEEAKELLMTMESSQSARLMDIGQRISSGQKVSSKEGKEFSKIFKSMSSALDGFQGSLSTNFGFMVEKLGKIANNSDAAMDDRRASLMKLQKIAQLDEIQNQLNENQKEKINKLVQLDSQNLNFNKKENKQISKLLFDLSDDTTDIKIAGTLDNLNRNLQESTITADELQETLEQQVGEGGKNVSEVLEEGMKSDIGQGLMDAILPGFSSVFSLGKDVFSLGGKALGAGAKGVGGIAKAVAKGVAMGGKGAAKAGGGLLKGAGGLLKGAGKFAKFLGPLAAAGFAAFDFAEGFNDPNKIAGLKEGEKASTGTKVQAGVSSAISGLTFGLVDPSTVYGGIEEGLDFVFGEDGLLSKAGDFFSPLVSMVGNALDFEGISESFKGIFSGEGILGKLQGLGKFILSVSPIGLVTSLIGDITGGFDGLFGEEGALTKLGNFFSGLMEKATSFSIIDTIKEGWDAVFGEDGVFSDVGSLFSKITDFDFTSLLPDSVASVLGLGDDDEENEKEKSSGGLLSAASSLVDGASDLVSGFFSNGDVESSKASMARASVSPVGAKMDNQSTIISQQQENEMREFRRRNQQQNAQVQPVVVDGGSQQKGKPVSKTSEINDMKLSSINLSLMD